ncbi:MAG: preprotein translocase subunit SecA, partial [Dokdonella sp.]
HYDVQLVGGALLHQGKIAEMRTGEGKTLVATAPLYLNALLNQGAHLVTQNDYLAKRDAQWMGRIYHALGMTTGIIQSSGEGSPDTSSYRFDPDYPATDDRFLSLRPIKRAEAYQCDITYGTNNEYGFDYLRDNMQQDLADCVQRVEDNGQPLLYYAVIDEVDNLLIDEARTPLIISGPSDESPQLYVKVNRIVPRMTRQASEDKPGEAPAPGDYWVDEKQKQVHMSEEGMQHAEDLLRSEDIIGENEGLYDSQHIAVVHHLNAALRANAIYQRDVDYIVRDGEIIIVDEFTGRTLAGRRWSDGLHQAVEAKEGVPIQRENQTLASITFQNLFRMYKKLSGMTGTADTEAYEFQSIYGLEVVVIPTHRPMVRKDEADVIFLKSGPKFDAIVEDIKESRERGQPVLVGTASIEMSELLSELLKKQQVPHEVLNAKQHEREAHIVAQAGQPHAITIATNMAGRGTDIVLGGSLEAELSALPEDASGFERERIKMEWQRRHDEVIRLGGLRIVGTERHESRRIDNQLRGRSGRQGDPGSSRFYLSLEDSLIRIFMGEGVAKLMRMFGMKEDDAIQDKMVSRQIEKAQRKVEAHNFDIRKHLLEFDDTANDQRKVIYEQRNELLDSANIGETIASIRQDVFTDLTRRYVPHDSIDEQWKISELQRELDAEFGLELNLQQWLEEQTEADANDVLDHVLAGADRMFREKEAMIGSEVMRGLEKHVMLSVLDNGWKEHLSNMDYLRQGIYLRAYAQKTPKQEFKREAFELFEGMLGRIKHEIVQIIARVRIRGEEEVEAMEEQQRVQAETQARAMQFQHAEAGGFASAQAPSDPDMPRAQMAVTQSPALRDAPKVGRNDPCPCGSGKKYKQCHGKLA